jgi:NAD(P)-dependent dehydrogenase (short-subunit alcohol dehydrogenase family)/acyl dehydratase/putative sterol carrier protein
MLDGKVAVITGAGGGLGASHAILLAKHGALVVVNDPGVSRDGNGNSKAADFIVKQIIDAGGKAISDYNDISTVDGVTALFNNTLSHFGKVDILVNNAGILRDKTLHNMTDDMWDNVINVHLKGTFLCTKEAAKYMKLNGGGSIVNTTSVAGLKGNFGQCNYSAAKAGIYGFTLTTSMELLKDSIRVNSIAPLAKTRMTAEIDSIPDDFKPEYVSDVVLFLVSDHSKNITGKTIGIHGKTVFEYKMNVEHETTSELNWTPQDLLKWINSPIKQNEQPFKQNQPKNNTKLEKIILALPSAFKDEHGRDWNAGLDFNTDDGHWYVKIENGVVTTGRQKIDTTCTITATSDIIVGMIEGRVNSNMAFMTGKLKSSNVKDLMKFGKCFSFSKLKAALNSSMAIKEESTALNDVLKGKKFTIPPVLVAADALNKYDCATNSRNSRIFPVTVVSDLFMQLFKDPDFNGDFSKMVHGEQTINIALPIVPNDILSIRGVVSDVLHKDNGDVLLFDQMIYCEGKLKVSMRSLLFFRNNKKSDKQKLTEQELLESLSQYTKIATIDVSRDTINQYADASGDRNPIHIDQNVARSVGFDDVILHGLGTLALVCGVLNGKPSQIHVRFSKPVYPGDSLDIYVNHGETDGRIVFKVISRNKNGSQIVLDNGVLG